MAEVMLDARDAALAGLLDDGAVGPPRRVAPAEALREHVAALDGPAGWLLGRLVLPLAAIDEVVVALDAEAAGATPVRARPIRVALGLSRAGAGTSGSTVGRDLGLAAPLLEHPAVTVDALQLAIAGRRPDAEVAALVTAVDAAEVPASVAVAVEIGVGERPPGEVVRLLTAMGRAAGERRLVAVARLGGGGGGQPAGDVEVAGLLLACAQTAVPVRLAAGAPGPLRRPRAEGGVDHGWLNVLAAAVVAHRGGRLPHVQSVLATPPTRARLGSGALIMDEEVLESDAIAACRAELLLGLRSADVAAEVAELVDLGVLADGGARP